MRTRRTFAILVAAVLLLGIADSMSGPYLVLFAADRAGLSPLEIGIFSSANGLGGIVISTLLGRRFDQHPGKRYAVAATVAGAIGFALLTLTTDFGLLVLLGLTLVGAVAAAFPQLFTLARVALGNGSAGQRSAPLLRSCWSLSWALGPLIGTALLARTGYTGILWATAIALLLTALVTLTLPEPTPTETTTDPAADPTLPETSLPGTASKTDHPQPTTGPPEPETALPPLAVALLALSVTLFFTAMFAGSLALPLFVTRELHEPETAIGPLSSACAAVEIVAALALAAVPARDDQRLLITGGMALFLVYFSAVTLTQGLGLLMVAQIARGTAIAVVGAAGIRYFQDALAPATGRATTLFANATTSGLLVAGILSGVGMETFGYRTTLLLCGAVAALGSATFWFASGPQFRPSAAPAGTVSSHPSQGGRR